MPRIVLKWDLDLNAANMPGRVFELMDGPYNETKDGIELSVMRENESSLRNAIVAARGAVQLDRRDDGLYIGKRIDAAPPMPAQAPAPAFLLTVADRALAQVPTFGGPPEAETLDEDTCQECEEHNDDCTCEDSQPNTVDVTKSGSSLARILDLTNSKIDEEDRVSIEIASNIGTASSGKAKRLHDELINYSNYMSKIIQCQRAINALGKEINSDEVVWNLKESIESLKSSNELISDVFIVKDYVVVFTKNIVTERLDDGNIYNVGKMALFISTKSLVSELCDLTAQSVYIINRTREVEGYACGHVESGGLACYGSWYEPLVKCLANGDLEGVVETLIRFIKNPHLADSWGCKIKYFPKVLESDNNTEVQEKAEEVSQA